jgi:hypothetical protein
MIAGGKAVVGQQVAHQRPEAALHAVAHYGIADSLGNGNAETDGFAAIGADQQDQTGAGNADTAIGGKEIGAPG